MLSDNIVLSYAMPNKEVLRVEIDPGRIFGEGMYAKARELHQIYEQDCLFIPNGMSDGITDYEPGRDYRRLQLLRDWSHDEASITEILT